MFWAAKYYSEVKIWKGNLNWSYKISSNKIAKFLKYNNKNILKEEILKLRIEFTWKYSYSLPSFCARRDYQNNNNNKKVRTDFKLTDFFLPYSVKKNLMRKVWLLPSIIYINATWKEWKWKQNHGNFIKKHLLF